MNSKLKFILKLLVSGIIILAISRFLNGRDIIENLRMANPLWLVTAIVILPISLFPRVLRFQLILNDKERVISHKGAWEVTLVGSALNFIIPGSLGDIARSYYGYIKFGKKEEMVSASILDKVIGMLVLFILGFVPSLCYGYYLFASISLIGIVMFSFPLFLPQIFPWRAFAKVLNFMTKASFDGSKLSASFQISPGTKSSALLLSLAGWIVTVIYFLIICLVFHVSVNLWYLFSIFPVVNLTYILPFTLKGLGTKEAVLIYLFSNLGINADTSILISLASTLVASVIPALIGLFLILRLKHK